MSPRYNHEHFIDSIVSNMNKNVHVSDDDSQSLDEFVIINENTENGNFDDKKSHIDSQNPKKSLQNIVMICDFQSYIKDLKDSFKKVSLNSLAPQKWSASLVDQVKIDFPRTLILINGVRILRYEDYLAILHDLLSDKLFAHCYLMSTQASMAFVYGTLCNHFSHFADYNVIDDQESIPVLGTLKNGDHRCFTMNIDIQDSKNMKITMSNNFALINTRNANNIVKHKLKAALSIKIGENNDESMILEINGEDV